MQIFLIRHAETDWNREGRCQGITDLDLNETGLRQAEEIAAFLKKRRVDAIYSSDLKRALRTAETIARCHGLEVRVDSSFRELNHGKLEGLTFAEIGVFYPEFARRWRSDPERLLVPGGERLIEVAKRAWKAMERIASAHLSDEALVVVSHHFPIAAILCEITGISLSRYRSFEIRPCRPYLVQHLSGGGWRAELVDGLPGSDGHG